MNLGIRQVQVVWDRQGRNCRWKAVKGMGTPGITGKLRSPQFKVQVCHVKGGGRYNETGSLGWEGWVLPVCLEELGTRSCWGTGVINNVP